MKDYSARLLAALFYGLPMSDQVAVTDKGVAELVRYLRGAHK